MTRKSRFIFPLIVLCFCPHAQRYAAAATVAAASCSSSDVQAAINSALSGDTVAVPGGTCTWASAVTIPNTMGITIAGGDGGSTTISGAFQLNQSSSAGSRITAFIFTSANAITTAGSTSSIAFRIDHNIFASSNQATFISTNGNAPGLIDHNHFTSDGASEMIHNLAMGASDASGWTDNVMPGSANMLFVEDNTFTYLATGNPAYFLGTSAIQSYYGARTVFRHNTLNNCQVDQHGTAGAIGARWWEIYENTFNPDVPNANQCCYVVLRGGSGVVFNNHQTGANQATGTIELYDEDSGYPAPYQPGSGVNQDYSPAYLWGNDSSIPVVSGSSNVQPGRDYFVSATQPASLLRQELNTDTPTTTYEYVPYTYPHPLQTQTTAPNPPTNVTVTVT